MSTGLRRSSFRPKTGPAQVLADLQQDGSVWCHAPRVVEQFISAPWPTLEGFLGFRPARIEILRIAHRNRHTSYVFSKQEARLHTDQAATLFPPVQLWLCIRPAAKGGESKLLDTWSLLDELANNDPKLLDQLFMRPRKMEFSTLTVRRPTFTLNEGYLMCTHPPLVAKRDPVGRKWFALVNASPVRTLKLDAGDILVNHNHRVLHGRTAFSDSARELIRIHVWLPRPLSAPDAYVKRAKRAIAKRVAGTVPNGARPRDIGALMRLSFVQEALGSIADGKTADRLWKKRGFGLGDVADWTETVWRAGLAELERQSRRKRKRK